MRKLTDLQLKNDMPCFDTKDVLFITNKWDEIRDRTTDSSDSSEEDEETKTWKALTESLKDKWPSVIEENIFKLNLKDVSFFLFILYHDSRVTLKINLGKKYLGMYLVLKAPLS